MKLGPIRCICCYDYSLKSFDLARVKDLDLINISAPCPQRVCCGAPGYDLVEVHPTSDEYGSKLVLKLPGGTGEKVCRKIMNQVEKNQIEERD